MPAPTSAARLPNCARPVCARFIPSSNFAVSAPRMTRNAPIVASPAIQFLPQFLGALLVGGPFLHDDELLLPGLSLALALGGELFEFGAAETFRPRKRRNVERKPGAPIMLEPRRLGLGAHGELVGPKGLIPKLAGVETNRHPVGESALPLPFGGAAVGGFASPCPPIMAGIAALMAFARSSPARPSP